METIVAFPSQPALAVAASSAVFPVRRVYCVGRNYADHAREMGFTGREDPFFFCKPADAIINVADGQTGEMPYPSRTSNLHYEVELVVALDKGGRDLTPEQAAECVWGYAIGLDMTRRDLQGEAKKQGRPWEVGKAFDQSAPVGPLHPRSKTGALDKGAITLGVNGEGKQKGDLSDMIWNVAESIAYLSTLFELKAGDIVFTGTPEGVGPVVAGDHMVGTINGLGELHVKVV
ncbi:FAA hydrolase family protein [Allopusillimonas soli]|uniref:Fumarylacetoacetate hydrolase family protein n=1 Tax=Allopusillimonas soli TaxID=659016 RepID=A0A853F9Z7_9BURK|nr:fumarylacetoacetate hydrolase family protein [Allopusillimonas soli]NYT36923.1 fumarylacetoacetate hydrolase family protein [Allopusillimonas soli]TEA75377.1 FAA hydrolase family protein [Allopusillimonas soli]